MNSFSERKEIIDRDAVRKHLLSLVSPCYESVLFKIAFPGSEISMSDALLLYQNHFLLFHVLYEFQDDFYREGKYLHVHFMRTFLADYPPAGMCRFYNEHTGRFCGEGCPPGQNYCSFHNGIVGESEIEELSARYFYLDTENYFKLDSGSAEAFIRGTWETLRHHDEFRKSLEVLDLPGSADIDMIKKRFRALAKKYHPDMGEKTSERFNEINRAYRLLLRLRSI